MLFSPAFFWIFYRRNCIVVFVQTLVKGFFQETGDKLNHSGSIIMLRNFQNEDKLRLRGQKQSEKTGQNKVRFFCLFLAGEFMGQISLKALRNNSASFGSYNFSISLCERPKPNMCMISGFFWDLQEPLFMDLNMQINFKI